FGDEARELRVHVRVLREQADIALPSIDLTAANLWLREMIEHEPLVRETGNALNGGWQLADMDQQIERQAEFRNDGKALDDPGPSQETIVRFGLRNVTHANELGGRTERCELLANLSRAGLQVDPPYHAGDRAVGFGEREQPSRLLDALLSLDGD